MSCAFTEPAKILPLHGRGRTALPGDPEFPARRANLAKDRDLGLRRVVFVDIDRIADSCGHAVPLMHYLGDRDVLDRARERRDEAYFAEYGAQHNATSVDGLSGLPQEAR